MTTIAQIDGKWYVVQSTVGCGVVFWVKISEAYEFPEQARAKQADIVFGRV